MNAKQTLLSIGTLMTLMSISVALGEEKIVLPVAEFDRIFQLGPTAHLSQMRAGASYKDGKPNGLKLTQIQSGSLWSLLKFENDDVLCGVDGDSDVNGLLVLLIPNKLRINRKLQLCRIRGTTRTSLFYSIAGQSSEAVQKARVSATAIKPNEQSSLEQERKVKAYESEREAFKNAGREIEANAKQNPDKPVSCRVQWKDISGIREVKKTAKAGDSFGWACLSFCMKTLEENKIVMYNRAYPDGTLCFSDQYPQAFPN